MLSEADRNKAADILLEAHKTKKQAVQLSTTYPGITIEDARGRLVPVQCISCPIRIYQPEKLLLPPRQSQSFSVSLTHGCYSLVPGERLSFIATYANLRDDEPIPSREVPVVRAPGWINITVPLGWPDDDAAEQGVASAGASPRR